MKVGRHKAGLLVLLLRYPNLKSVRELIYKRGFGKVDKRRTALTDNAIIENVSRESSVGLYTLCFGKKAGPRLRGY